MKCFFSYYLPILLIGLFLLSCQQPSNNENTFTAAVDQATQNPFLGSWELDRFFNQDTSRSFEGLSIIIFRENYFSYMASPSERKSFEKVGEPSEEELREAFNTFTAFTGPYEFSDSTITMTRLIVKRPNWMNPPRVDHYAYQVRDGEIHFQLRYQILEGEKSSPENALTIVMKRK